MPFLHAAVPVFLIVQRAVNFWRGLKTVPSEGLFATNAHANVPLYWCAFGFGVLVGLPFSEPGSVGKITCVFVGNKNRIVDVGNGVFVGEAVEVGDLVGVCVGG